MSLRAANALLREIRACEVCALELPAGPRPVVQLHPEAKLLIIGQAPGRKVHESGVPWKDASGNRLRDWLGIDDDFFYDRKKVALMPMGFCYPGSAKSGDLPPRKECLPQWHAAVLGILPRVELTLLIGTYAQKEYLPRLENQVARPNLTENVKNWRQYPERVPLPHPSPRNQFWLRKNPWFETELLPELRARIEAL